MNRITQELKFRQAVFKHAELHGVTKAANKYHVNRQFIYRMKWKYDGTPESLMPKSRRPHHHPNEHSEEEIQLIKDMRKEYPFDGLNTFWYRLRRVGYKRAMSALFRVMRRLSLYREKKKNPKYLPKPYQKALYPGEKVQIDVKVVPSTCIVGEAKKLGQKFYQFTAIDECTRIRYLGAFDEQSTYSSMLFLQDLVRAFPFKINKIQTDNGTEFTKKFTKAKEGDKTLFEEQLEIYGIEHQKIRPYTPRHNGKVERSHRGDNEQFYACQTFDSFADFKRKLAQRNLDSNDIPMRPLRYKSPNEFLQTFL